MVCNISKTELVNLMEDRQSTISVSGHDIKSTKSLKVLGIWLDHKLKWNLHIDKVVERTTKTLNGIKIIKRKFTKKQLQAIITSQVFGVLYYGAACWLTKSLSSINYKKLNKIHYAACRLIVGDWRKVWNKELLNKTTNRLPPRLWCNYNAANFTIKCIRDNKPSTLSKELETNLYHNDRHLNPKLMDKSRKKIGLQCIYNWAGSALDKINFRWYKEDLTNDMIRTRLKKIFYPPSYQEFQ